MQVKLVAVTMPRPDIGCADAEEFVAYAARVSNPSNQNNSETAGKLVKYLIENNHWSPLEMVSVTMEIITTRDIARQILRHRSFSFQEFSQRYAVATEFELRDARLQDKKNRQNSIKTDDEHLNEWWADEQQVILDDIQELYTAALDKGIAMEQARAILPEGCTVSKLYMAGTLRSWVHYVALRSANGTQLEHMDIARACKEELRKEFPSIMKVVDNL